MRSVVVVGNPKVQSRTLDAAVRVVTALTAAEPTTIIELAPYGQRLLEWSDPDVLGLVELVSTSDLVVFASPTFKGTYTGLLKLFLEKFDGGTGLEGVSCVPLMLGASERHAMSVEQHLRPLLSELGGTTAAPGLFLLDHSYVETNDISLYVRRWGQSVLGQQVVPAKRQSDSDESWSEDPRHY